MTSDEIKEAVSLLDVARSYGLKIGRGNKVRCPFHADRNASMSIHPKFFHCFGCEAKGDVFTFIQMMEGISFHDAYLKLGGDGEKKTPTRSGQTDGQRLQRECAKRIRDTEERIRGLKFDLFHLERLFSIAEPFSDPFAFACNQIPVVNHRIVETYELKWELERIRDGRQCGEKRDSS